MSAVLAFMGYVGSGLVVVSYFAAQQRWLSQKSLAYLLANFPAPY